MNRTIKNFGHTVQLRQSPPTALRGNFMAAFERATATHKFALRLQHSRFNYFMQKLELLLPGRTSYVGRMEKAFGRPEHAEHAVLR